MFFSLFAGNPRLLLLDEPSTGKDAGAKRVLWKVLQSLGKDGAILLTTHSMEETEALATKVSIVGRKMLASDTVTSLREKYGGCFRVRASYEPGSEIIVERLLFVEFGLQMKGLKMGFGEVSFELPSSTERDWGDYEEDEGVVEDAENSG